MRSVVLGLAGALLLAACGDSEPVDEAEPATVPPDAVPPDIRSSDTTTAAEAGPGGTAAPDPVAEGQWFASHLSGAPAAMFGPPGSEASFSVRCEGDELVFARAVRLPQGSASMRLTVDGVSRTIPAESAPEPLPLATGRLDAGSAFAALLGETTRPIAVTVEGGPSLRVPADPALLDVVNDCRA